jgi:hypothetical protein
MCAARIDTTDRRRIRQRWPPDSPATGSTPAPDALIDTFKLQEQGWQIAVERSGLGRSERPSNARRRILKTAVADVFVISAFHSSIPSKRPPARLSRHQRMSGIKFDKRKVPTLYIGFLAARYRMATTHNSRIPPRRDVPRSDKRFDAVHPNSHLHRTCI